MTPTRIRYLSYFFGLTGALMGFYIWKDYLPIYYGDTLDEWKRTLRLYYIIFLFIPSSIALISSIFNKTYLMYLAFLLSLPVTKYLGIKPLLISTFPLIYYPLVCYFISAIFMSIKTKKINRTI